MKKRAIELTNTGARVSREAQYAMNISRYLIYHIASGKVDMSIVTNQAQRATADNDIEVDFNTLMFELKYHAIVLKYIRKAAEMDILLLRQAIEYYKEELATTQPCIDDTLKLLNEVSQNGELPTY